MTLQACYTALEGNYDDVVNRLRSERLVQKFVLKFLDDGSYGLLCDSMAGGQADEAFRAAHTIKGMCQNLAFQKLERSSSALTEALRSGSLEGTESLFAQVRADYEQTADAIRTYRSGLEA